MSRNRSTCRREFSRWVVFLVVLWVDVQTAIVVSKLDIRVILDDPRHQSHAILAQAAILLDPRPYYEDVVSEQAACPFGVFVMGLKVIQALSRLLIGTNASRRPVLAEE